MEQTTNTKKATDLKIRDLTPIKDAKGGVVNSSSTFGGGSSLKKTANKTPNPGG